MFKSDVFNLSSAAESVKAGGVIIYPAEGVFGVGCDPFSRPAVERLLQLKKRPVSQGLIVLCDSLDRARKLVVPDHQSAWERAASMWPGPTTLLMPANSQVPDWITGGRTKVALRVPSFAPLVEITSACGGYLVSTSANLSGHGAVSSAADLDAALLEQVDYVLENEVESQTGATVIIDAVTGEIIRPRDNRDHWRWKKQPEKSKTTS